MSRSARKKREGVFIKNPDIKRMCRIAGVFRIKDEVYDEVRAIISDDLSNVVRNALIFTFYAQRSTMSSKDVMFAVKSLGYNLIMGKKVNPMKKKAPAKKSRKLLKPGQKPRRSKPGTAAKREIKKFQRNSDKLVLQMTPFRRLVEKISHQYSTGKGNLRYGGTAINALQFYIEDKVIKILQNANALAVKIGGRRGIFVKDIQVARANLENMTLVL